jgi:hypothetical protein
MVHFPSLPPSALLLAVALTVPLASQATGIPGSGCPGGPAVAVTGEPRVGESLTLRFTCPAGEAPLLLFGEALRPRQPLPQAITCGQASCLLAVSPDLLVHGTANQPLEVRIDIPNAPRFVGFQLGVQGVCIAGMEECITLGSATLLTVQAGT